jgi:hypothetical protein
MFKNISNLNERFSDTIILASNHKEKNIVEDVKPWEGFRGWSPRVPYSNKNSVSIESKGSKKSNQTDENHLSPKDLEDPNSSNRSKKQGKPEQSDDVKDWEGFRGWSPRVPYGN